MLMNLLKRFKKKGGKTKELSRMYEIGEVWDSAVQWFKFEDRRVVGWKCRRPKVGDFIKCDLQSGKVGIFRFTEVKLERDPPDMFFGTVQDFGYEGEVKLPELYVRPKGEIRFI